MRRSLTKLGNNSYVVTLPKAWIRKHNLEPKTSLEITEAGSKLIISTDIIRSELSPHVVCCEDGNEVSINSKIIALYRAGYSEAKLIDTKASPEILGKVCKYASNFPGVTIEQKENAIIMKSTEGLGRRSEIIGKCYLNLLMFSDLLAAEVKAVDWEKQLNDMYQSINFHCESVFRLISIEGGLDVKTATKDCSRVLFFQCLSEVLKMVAETETETGKERAGPDIKRLIKYMCNVCMMKKSPDKFYSVSDIISSKISEKKYGAATADLCFLCRNYCMKLVGQEINFT